MKLLLLLALVQMAICAPKKEQTAKSKPIIKTNVGQVTKRTNTKPGTISKQIIGGDDAALGQFPWHVRITSISGSRARLCGGSLIRSQWVLTAAHCTYGYSTFEVILGEVDRSSDPTYKITMTTNAKHDHPNYNNNVTLINDIALLMLPRAVEYTVFIAPVNLPLPSDADKSFANIQAQICGFGDPTTSGNYSSSTLKYTTLAVISNDECGKFYGMNNLATSLICAVKKNTSVCNGDSGGALVYKNETAGFWVQIGIASFTPGVNNGGCLGGPSAYTRVSSYFTWIKNTMDSVPFLLRKPSGSVTIPEPIYGAPRAKAPGIKVPMP